MSYREIRNFTEIMRALGYPRLISINKAAKTIIAYLRLQMENFRKPNFELVADILYWMVKLYEPDTTISDRVEFEDERVVFLTGIANLMATKARLKLSTRKLYASDGRAVQEMLKLATLLYSAQKSALTTGLLITDNPPPPLKVCDVKAARQLASDITLSGAKVFDLLENENMERHERARAIRFLDKASSSSDGAMENAYIERSVRELIDSSKQAVEDARKECEELEADEKNLESRVHKKQEELERTEKRLKNLDTVRPQFMDEVEKLEKELQKQYDIYIEKYRNLDFLERESEKYRRHEEERLEEQEGRLKKTRERLLKEEVDLLRGGRGDGDDEYLGGVPVVRMGQTAGQYPTRIASRVGGAGSGVGPRSTHRDNEGSDALTDDHDHSDSMSGNSTDDDSDRSGRNKPSQRPAGRGITAQSGASSGIEHKEDPRGRGNGTARSPGYGPGGYSPGSSPGYGPGSGPRSGGRIGKMVCDSEDFLDDDDDDDHENESPGSDDDF